jgi:hypothetical protein
MTDKKSVKTPAWADRRLISVIRVPNITIWKTKDKTKTYGQPNGKTSLLFLKYRCGIFLVYGPGF